MSKKLTIALAALAISALGASSASAAGHGYCVNYAQLAVGQSVVAKQRGFANLWWPRWGTHTQGHYTWCRTVSSVKANSERAARQNRLNLGF